MYKFLLYKYKNSLCISVSVYLLTYTNTCHIIDYLKITFLKA